MPPRYAYWTILVDDQPTAFRAGAKEDLLPTFNRLKQKQPTAKMVWFQNGKLWDSRLDAQEAMRARGEIGRRNDDRQSGFRARPRSSDRPRRPVGEGFPVRRSSSEGGSPPDDERREKPEWKPKTPDNAKAASGRQDPGPRTPRSEKLDWKPKGEGAPREERKPRSDAKPAWRSEKPAWSPKTSRPPAFAKATAGKQDLRTSRSEKPQWRPKTHDPGPRTSRSDKPDWKAKPDWKPKSAGAAGGRPSGRSEKPAWQPKGQRSDWKPKTQAPSPRTSHSEKLEWRPKTQDPGPRTQDPGRKTPEKRKWVPKEEYKRSMGIEAKKDKNWRPGGEHKDPRQKYKDAKKAKWSRFKQNIRAKSQGKKKEQ